jgi:hypothetical protein
LTPESQLIPNPNLVTALVIGPGGGRTRSRRSCSARHVDGVEINPIIADDVMRGFPIPGGIYTHPRVASSSTTAGAVRERSAMTDSGMLVDTGGDRGRRTH